MCYVYSIIGLEDFCGHLVAITRRTSEEKPGQSFASHLFVLVHWVQPMLCRKLPSNYPICMNSKYRRKKIVEKLAFTPFGHK
jgi:hypothetical protein